MLLFGAADATSDLKVRTQNSLGSITGETPFIKTNLTVFQDGLQILKDIILNFPKSSLIAYLNLNSLRNKTNDLRIVRQDIPSRLLLLKQTKTRSSFPTAQFPIPGYEIRARRDRRVA